MCCDLQVAEFLSWLSEKEAAQRELADYEEPAFHSDEVCAAEGARH